MRYPVDNFNTQWNGTAGYGFGDQTSYGFHDGVDINDNNGGNSDLGKPLYAIAKGKVVGIHNHTSGQNFGKHFFIMIEGKWGTRYVHYAHCLEITVAEGQEVSEGQLVGKVGNSGTTYAHCHFAIKKKANGMDTIATTKAQLNDAWEDPLAFIEKYRAIIAQDNAQPNSSLVITDQTRIPQIENKQVDQIRSELFDTRRDLKSANETKERLVDDLAKAVDAARDMETLYKQELERPKLPSSPSFSIAGHDVYFVKTSPQV